MKGPREASWRLKPGLDKSTRPDGSWVLILPRLSIPVRLHMWPPCQSPVMRKALNPSTSMRFPISRMPKSAHVTKATLARSC